MPRLGVRRIGLATVADVDAVLPRLSAGVALLLDTGELLAAGEDPVACARAWGARIRLVYLRDLRDGETVGLGEGELDVSQVRGELERSGYDGPLVVEVPGQALS